MATLNIEKHMTKTSKDNSDFKVFKVIKAIVESMFSNLSLAAAPLLPATLFGLSVWEYLVLTVPGTAATFVGVVAGFSIEAAGYNAFKAKEKSDKPVLAIAYLAVGVLITVVLEFGEWKRMLIGLAGFAIVAIVYWSIHTIDQEEASAQRLAEVEAELKRKEEEAAEAEQKRLEEAEAWERKQAEKEAEFERQMKAQDAELKAQLKLKKVSAQVGGGQSDWRSLSAQQRAQLPLMETSEIVAMYGCSPSTARRWRNQASAE